MVVLSRLLNKVFCCPEKDRGEGREREDKGYGRAAKATGRGREKARKTERQGGKETH